MEAAKSLTIGFLLAGVLLSFMPPSAAYVFTVGGRAGWVQSPAVPYNNWAGALRFQVNDSLVFKYKKGDDSVLVVNKSGYDSCNTSGPLEKLDGGDSVYKLPRSGPNYFISGEVGHCNNGQKLIVVVLAIRNKPIPPSPIATPPSVAVPPSIATPPSAAVPPSIATPPSAAVPPSIATPPSLPPSAEPPTPLPAPTSTPPEAPVVSPPPGAPGPPGTGLPPVSAPPPAGKTSSSTVLRVSGVTVGTAALLLGGALFG